MALRKEWVENAFMASKTINTNMKRHRCFFRDFSSFSYTGTCIEPRTFSRTRNICVKCHPPSPTFMTAAISQVFGSKWIIQNIGSSSVKTNLNFYLLYINAICFHSETKRSHNYRSTILVIFSLSEVVYMIKERNNFFTVLILTKENISICS